VVTGEAEGVMAGLTVGVSRGKGAREQGVKSIPIILPRALNGVKTAQLCAGDTVRIELPSLCGVSSLLPSSSLLASSSLLLSSSLLASLREASKPTVFELTS
jgi:hypothetical protein